MSTVKISSRCSSNIRCVSRCVLLGWPDWVGVGRAPDVPRPCGQVVRCAVRCNMWSRNGESVYRQAWFYVSSNFSDYGPDLDVHILQACGIDMGWPRSWW